MAIYDKNGHILASAYDKNGNRLSKAYDKNGHLIFSTDSIILKVMTYNVGQWYIGSGTNVPSAKDADYYALQKGMLERADADILCIEEYWKIFSQIGRTALSILQEYFPYIHEQGGDSGYFGRCICSKYPISNYTVRNYAHTPSRYYDSCTVTIDNKDITLIITHPSVHEVDRQQELPDLLNYLETLDTFILCGDFNTGISESTGNVDSTNPYYITNVKPFVDAGYNTANFGEHGFLLTCVDGVYGTGTNWYIDNIYTSSDIDILSASVDTVKITDSINDKVDHMPLIATLQIN